MTLLGIAIDRLSARSRTRVGRCAIVRWPRRPRFARVAWKAAPGNDALRRHHRDRAFEQPLDLGEQSLFVGSTERNGLARGARAARAADTMNIILGRLWKIIVYDE